MASPSEDITAFAKRLRNGLTSAGDDPQAQAAAPQAQAAGGSTAAMLRNTVPKAVTPVAPVAPAAPAAPPAVGMGRVLAAGKSAAGSIAGVPGAAATKLSGVMTSPTTLGAGGTALAAAPEALRVGNVLANKDATWADVGTQAGEGTGRLATAGLGAATGAVAGSPFGPIGAAAGGVLGGAYGYWAGDKAIRGLRGMAGLDTRSPDQQLGVAPGQQAATPSAPAAATAAPHMPPNPTDTRLATGAQGPVMPPVAASPTAAKNEVLRNGNSFSGTNVKEGFSYVNPDGSMLGSNAPPGNGMGIGVDGYMKQLANLRALPEPERGGMGGIGNTDTLRQSPIDPNWMAKHQMANSGSPLDRRQAMMLASQEGIANKSNSQALALAQLREGGENSRAQLGASTARRGQDIQQGLGSEGHAVTREGNQMQLEGHLAPLAFQQRQMQLAGQIYKQTLNGQGGAGGDPVTRYHDAAAQFEALGMTAQAKDAREAADRVLTSRGTVDAQDRLRVADTHEQLKPYFTSPDPKDPTKQVFDEPAARRAQATIRQVVPGYDGLPAPQKRAVEQEVIARQKNMAAEARPTMGFIDRAKDLVGMYEQPPEATAPVDLRGAGPAKRAGLFSPPGVNRNARQYTTVNGDTYTYGNGGPPSDEQIKDLEARRQLRTK